MDLDRHVPRDSPIHRFDARLKLILALAAIVAITLLPAGSLVAYVIVFARADGSVAAGTPRSRPAGARVLDRAALRPRVAAPHLHAPGRAALLDRPRAPRPDGDARGASRRAVASSSRAGFPSRWRCSWPTRRRSPTSSTALRSMRLPAILVSIVSFMYRYLAVIGEEAGRMRRATGLPLGLGGRSRRECRLARQGHGRRMVGSLFVRSYERSERVYAAMLARGFDGHPARHRAGASLEHQPGRLRLLTCRHRCLHASITFLLGPTDVSDPGTARGASPGVTPRES